MTRKPTKPPTDYAFRLLELRWEMEKRKDLMELWRTAREAQDSAERLLRRKG